MELNSHQLKKQQQQTIDSHGKLYLQLVERKAHIIKKTNSLVERKPHIIKKTNSLEHISYMCYITHFYPFDTHTMKYA